MFGNRSVEFECGYWSLKVERKSYCRSVNILLETINFKRLQVKEFINLLPQGTDNEPTKGTNCNRTNYPRRN